MIVSKKQYSIQSICCDQMTQVCEEVGQIHVNEESGDVTLKCAAGPRKIVCCPFCGAKIRKRGLIF